MSRPRPAPHRAALAAAAVASWIAGCSDPASALGAPTGDVAIAIQGPTEAVEFGAPFELRVTRAWRTDLAVEPWDDGFVAPLIATTRDASQTTDGGRNVETRTLVAHAFGSPTVDVPALTLTATGPDGIDRQAYSVPLTIAVTSSLGPEAGTQPELPEALEPAGRTMWTLALAALIGTVAMWGVVRTVRARRATSPNEPPPTPAEDTHTDPAAAEAALAALAALRQRAAGAATGLDTDTAQGDPAAIATETAQVVRHFCHRQFGWDTEHATREELVARAEAPAPARALAAALNPSDLIKFARLRPNPEQARRAIEHGEAFVRATAPTASPEAPPC